MAVDRNQESMLMDKATQGGRNNRKKKFEKLEKYWRKNGK